MGRRNKTQTTIMKKSILVILICFAAVTITLQSCSSKLLVGKLTMMSDRNIDSKGSYVCLKTYAGSTKKEIYHSRARTIEEALNNTIKSVPGGEFGKNVKIYQILPKKEYWAIECDVWGYSDNQQMMGFRIGDRVQWISLGKKHTGTIASIIDDKQAMVTDDSDNEAKKVNLESLAKI